MLQLSCASTSIFNIASLIMAKESLQRQTASYWKIMGLELPVLYGLSTLNYVFGVSFCSYAIKIFTFPDKGSDIFIPVVLHEITQHVWRRCYLMGYCEDGVRAIWTTMGRDVRGGCLKCLFRSLPRTASGLIVAGGLVTIPPGPLTCKESSQLKHEGGDSQASTQKHGGK